MSITMTECELLQLGFQVDPMNPSQAVPIKADDLPSDSWTFDRLMTYGTAAVAESGRLLAEATNLARKSTIQIFRAGRALSFARSKLPVGQTWGESLKRVGIPRTNAWEAMQLFEKAGSEEAIASLSPTEAKHKFEITKPKPRQQEGPENPSIISLPRAANEAQDATSSSRCDEDDDLDDQSGGDELATDDESHESTSVNLFAEQEDDEPPIHESESVLRLLVKVNAVLAIAATMPAAVEDQEAVEAEVLIAHKLLDEIDEGAQ